MSIVALISRTIAPANLPSGFLGSVIFGMSYATVSFQTEKADKRTRASDGVEIRNTNTDYEVRVGIAWA